MKTRISGLHATCILSLVLLFPYVGCQNSGQPVLTQPPSSESEPEPKKLSRVQGTSDAEIIHFVESLTELKSIDAAFELIHPQCLPALAGADQKKDCNQKLTAAIQSTKEDVFTVSKYDDTKTFWKSGEYETAIVPELVVTTKPDWDKTYFPFQDGFIKWLLAKDGDQWRIVMPAVADLKLSRDKRIEDASLRESKMTGDQKVQSAAEIAKGLPEELKAELKGLIEAGDSLKAIKRCREETGSGLAVAKAIVDNLKAEWAAAK